MYAIDRMFCIQDGRKKKRIKRRNVSARDEMTDGWNSGWMGFQMGG